MTTRMPVRSVRIPDQIWQRLEVEAARRSEEQGRAVTVADLIREGAEKLLVERTK